MAELYTSAVCSMLPAQTGSKERESSSPCFRGPVIGALLLSGSPVVGQAAEPDLIALTTETKQKALTIMPLIFGNTGSEVEKQGSAKAIPVCRKKRMR